MQLDTGHGCSHSKLAVRTNHFSKSNYLLSGGTAIKILGVQTPFCCYHFAVPSSLRRLVRFTFMDV